MANGGTGPHPADLLERQRVEAARASSAARAAKARAQAREWRSAWQRGLYTTGRMFIGAVFVFAAVDKLVDWGGTLSSLEGTPLDPHSTLGPATAFELTLGSFLMVGLFSRLVALCLLGYVLAAVLVVHPDLSLDLGRAVAVANLGFAAALVMVLAHGGGALSLDRLIGRRGRQGRNQ